MDFVKMQGAGNDFVVMEASGTEYDWPRLAIAMCDRHFGIGADGLLLVMSSIKADARMRIFNADGSEAETCGNGLRCLVRYLIDKGKAGPDTTELDIETLAGISRARLGTGRGGIQVGMGIPRFRAEEIPVTIESGRGVELDIITHPVAVLGREINLNLVSMGNPHAVHFQEQPVADFPLVQIGPQVECHEMFPNRTNFEVARVMSRGHIEVRVWERGAGETLACGSGACAVAAAAKRLDYADARVKIELPGGTLEIEWDGRGEVFLSGPAEKVFTGQWPD